MSDVVIIRFPDGSKEFRYPGHDLAEGDVVWHEGTAYRVLSISSDGGPHTVTVEPDSEELGDLLSSERGGILLVPAD